MLLQKGADPYLQDREGKYPIDYLSSKGEKSKQIK